MTLVETIRTALDGVQRNERFTVELEDDVALSVTRRNKWETTFSLQKGEQRVVIMLESDHHVSMFWRGSSTLVHPDTAEHFADFLKDAAKIARLIVEETSVK